MGRVRAPVDDDVRPVLGLTEGAARVAVVEYGEERTAVADGSAVVEHGSRLLGDFGRSGHALAVGRSEPVDQGLLRVVKHSRRVIDRFIVRDLFIGAVRLAEAGEPDSLALRCVVEDLVADGTGVLHLEDLLSVIRYGYDEVVAADAAVRASDVFNFLWHH